MKRNNGEFKLSTKWMKEKYDKFNDEIFDSDLPNIDFGLSRAASHAGWARYRKNVVTREVTPLKILLSTYLNPTEEIATNTMLHEMIHIADYAFYPEHFFDNDYDSHMSDFFQGWMEKINSMGYSVSVTVTNEERDIIKKESAKMNQEKEAIAIVAKWYGSDRYYDIAWTERKYLADVVAKNSDRHYQTLTFCRILNNNILTSKECKGKLMKGSMFAYGISKQYLQQNKNIELPGFKQVDVSYKILSNREKMMLLNEMDTISRSLILDLNMMFDNLAIERKTNGDGQIAFSRILELNGRDYYFTIGDRHTEIGIWTYKGMTMIDIPMRKETVRAMKEEYKKRENGQVYFLSKIENAITREVEEGLRNIKTAESMLGESRNRRLNLDVIVEEKIKDFVYRQTDKTDDSIVNVKELGDGSEIVTQW